MPESKKVLLQYVDDQLSRRRFALKTKKSYGSWVSRFTDFFGKYSLSDFTLEDISEFMRSLDEKDGLSASSKFTSFLFQYSRQA
jgi:site-specific recombinase XerD